MPDNGDMNGDDMNPPAAGAAGDASNQIMLSASMFPNGMAPKAGDKLVLGQADDSGNIPCTLEVAQVIGDDKEKEDWEDGLRKSMSSQTGQEDAA